MCGSGHVTLSNQQGAVRLTAVVTAYGHSMLSRKLLPSFYSNVMRSTFVLGCQSSYRNAVLYLEARVPSVMARFRLLTVKTVLRLQESHSTTLQTAIIRQPTSFFNVHWPRFSTPQVVLAQRLFEPLSGKIAVVTSARDTTSRCPMKIFLIIFTQKILSFYLNECSIPRWMIPHSQMILWVAL